MATTQANTTRKKATPAKPADPPAKVAGVEMAKVDEAHLRTVLPNIGVSQTGARTMPVQDAVQVVSDYMRAKTPPKDLVDCDVCGGASDANLDACPYCSDASAVEASDQHDNGTPNDDDAEEDADEEDDADEDDEAVAAEAAEEDEVATTTATKGKSKSVIKRVKANGKSNGTTEHKAIVVAREDLPDGVTVEALDANVSQVQQLKADGAEALHALGLAIAENYTQQLWKARQKEDGSPAYKSFNTFCQDEFGMTSANAYGLMDVCKAFDAAHVRTYGTSKLGLILKAPAEDQAKLLVAAKDHTKRDLQKRVTKAKQGKPARETGRKKVPVGVPGAVGIKAAARDRDRITVASIIRNGTAKLFLKPPAGEEPSVFATKPDQEPIGWIDLENKVKLWLRLIKGPEGNLVVKYSFKRIDPE